MGLLEQQNILFWVFRLQFNVNKASFQKITSSRQTNPLAIDS